MKESNVGITKNKFNSFNLIEDTELDTDKRTLDYYENNLKFLSDYVESKLRIKGFPECDADIVISDLYISLLKSRDYGDDINDYNYTLDSFVRRNADFCIDRYIRNYVDYSNHIDTELGMNRDGDEYSKLDLLEDTKANKDIDRACDDFYKALKSIEYKRYCFGVDIYNLLFIGICNIICNSSSKFREILDIQSCDMNKAYSVAVNDVDFMNCLYAATSLGSDIACLLKLKEFIYDFNTLVRVIDLKVA